jgi:hypothetical protein
MLRIAAILFAGIILCSCASGWNMGDVIPHWLGGPPKNLPPRAGQPAYEEYMRRAREEAIPTDRREIKHENGRLGPLRAAFLLWGMRPGVAPGIFPRTPGQATCAVAFSRGEHRSVARDA